MSLRELQLECEYRSDQANLVDSFYIPCLSQSVEYWRAVGFFTSQSLALAAKGLAAFINRGGRMRLVASPLFEPEDVEALLKGYEAREDVLDRAILRQFSPHYLAAASRIAHQRLECLVWLIAEKRLDVKVALPQKDLLHAGPAIYHEKIGVFFDSEGDMVAFTGSPNETVGGLVSNFESLDVFVSWDDPHQRTTRKKANFERLWNDTTNGLTVLDFPAAAKKRLLELRPLQRPVSDPESGAIHAISGLPSKSAGDQAIGVPPDVKLRDYQLQACQAWMDNGGRGLLVMATGTGKTITALASAVRLARDQGRLFLVVACPFQHLVDQWARDIKRFGFNPILAYESRSSWEGALSSRILDYNCGNREVVAVITTHSTFIGSAMQDALSRVKGAALLIADEVHHLGAAKGRENLPDTIRYRMGLSATPDRWFDQQGTTALAQYFGETVFEFPLKDAIRDGYLCEYYYYPKLVELTDEELEQYEALTKRIAQLFSIGAMPGEDVTLDALLRRRSLLLNTASNKLDALRQLLDQQQNLHHALFYCVTKQIDEVIRLLGNEFGIRVHRFTQRESTYERAELLKAFDYGELQALAAIRCLDEGVDVPSTRIAFLLASSSNPREFIQRRGRILRKAAGKERAIIHDLIAVPCLSPSVRGWDEQPFNIERGILKRELARFREFAGSASNGFQATDVIWDLAKAYNILDF